jgi:hypothetical protein
MNLVPEAEEIFGIQYQYNGARDEIIFPCPRCPEGKAWKLYVNIESGGFKCWRCGYKGYVHLPSSVNRNYTPKAPMTLEEVQAVPVERGTGAYYYLRGRGVTDRQIEMYGLCVSKLASWRGGIIIPSGDDTYSGFVVRIFDRNASFRWKDKPADQRYHNSPGFRRYNTIFNYTRAKAYRVTILTEGPFSGIASGYNAVSFYGKDMTAGQLEKILLMSSEEYVIAYDGDIWGRENRHRVASTLFSTGKKVSIVSMPPDKDPAQIDDLKQRLESRIPVSEMWLLEEGLRLIRETYKPTVRS